MSRLSERCFYFIFRESRDSVFITKDGNWHGNCLNCDGRYTKRGRCTYYTPFVNCEGDRTRYTCYSFEEVLESYRD